MATAASSPPRQRSKLVPLLLLIAVALSATAYFWRHPRAPAPYAGTLEATIVDIPARLATVIKKRHAGEGDAVTEGQTLFTLDCDELTIQKELAEANYQRGLRLLKSGSLPQEGFDQLRATREKLSLNYTWCTVSAPQEGRLLTNFREEGEWVAPGVPLASIADLSRLWAYIYVPQARLAELRVGMQVHGILPEIARRDLVGTIVKINNQAEFTPKNVQTRDERTRLVYGIKIEFNNSEGLFKPGMPIEVELPESNGHE